MSNPWILKRQKNKITENTVSKFRHADMKVTETKWLTVLSSRGRLFLQCACFVVGRCETRQRIWKSGTGAAACGVWDHMIIDP